MVEVWILEIGCYSDRFVAGVFASREEAHRQLARRGLVQHDSTGSDETWGPPGEPPVFGDVHSLEMMEIDAFQREECVAVTSRQEVEG